jgi:hypothetical protein
MCEQNDNNCKRHRTAMICITALEEGVVNQIMSAVNFEEIKASAIVVILRSESRGAQLSGIVEKGKAQDGKVGGHDCLIDSFVDIIFFWSPPCAFSGGGGPLSFDHCCDIVGSLRL